MTINVASRNEYIPSKYILSSLQLLERVIVQEFFWFFIVQEEEFLKKFELTY